MIPDKIGRYQILGPLGKGTMGVVHRAYDPDTGREMALKELTTPQDPIEAGKWRQRFGREVRAAIRLKHPHIVTVYDVDLEREPPYLVMELLTGDTLKELLLKQKSLPWQTALTLLQPLCQALAYAHRAGVIHRDVKPANVIFAGDEARTIKLVDFGLARWEGGTQVTQTGDVVGTLAYMSPEQAREEVVDARTDIFSLGVILFEAIAGYNPLDKGSFNETWEAVRSYEPIDLEPLEGKAPSHLIKVIQRALEKDRDQRYSTCADLLADLDRCLGTKASRPVIKKAGNIYLTSEMEVVLRAMFSDFDSIAVKAEFGHGLSGGRAFWVSPVKSGTAQLPAVVKIAPSDLIQQEWRAYKKHVKDTLPGIARIESDPILPPGNPMGALRYALAGEGIFDIQSLHDYYHEASTDELLEVLEQRLFKIMGHWWLHHQTGSDFQMQADYDALLPVNLLIKHNGASSKGTTHPIEPSSLLPPSIATGDHVQIKGFVITEVNEKQQQLTLNLPSTAEDLPSRSYRLRLENVSDINRYRVGDRVDSICGEVTNTRDDLLAQQTSQALEMPIDPLMERLTSPSGLSLPNPLAIYQDLLYDFFKVRISTVHRDFNLENVLVDEHGNVTLIDFATVRRGHVLHDLLRLETEVVTKLIPEALTRAKLSSETIYAFYEQLHYATFRPEQFTSPKLPHAGLEKPFKMLVAIRKMARRCLFNQDDWTEYYQGLTLYLLGALKFKNLDELPEAPLPKQVAFWGAATIQKLLSGEPSPPSFIGAAPMEPSEALTPPPMQKSPLAELWAAVMSKRQRRGCYAEFGRVLKFAILFLVPLVIGGILLARSAGLSYPTPTAVAMLPTGIPTVTSTNTPADTPSPILTSTPTSTGTPTPAPTATPTPMYCAVVKAENLNVRYGPSTRYDIVGGLKKGNRLKVTGRNLEGNWLKVICPDMKEGWVARSQVEVICAIGVAIAAVPPTPTPLPAPTLLEPENGALFMSHEVQLKWEWTTRTLRGNEYFSIRIRPERDSEVCWHPRTKATQYSGPLVGCESGKHCWSVVVAREDAGSPTGWWEISVASEEQCFEYIRPDD